MTRDPSSNRSIYSIFTVSLLVLVLAACSRQQHATNPRPPSSAAEQAASNEPQLLASLDLEQLGLPAVQPNSLALPIGLFLTTHQTEKPARWSQEQAAQLARELLDDANTILDQCDLQIQLETAQVVALPDELMEIEGNRRGSWGGHPPEDVDDVELFTYNENERLTEETRRLFAYGKQHTQPNTIAAFTVAHITYYIGTKQTGAGGLSFPPNAYHHPDDYPLRNSVLLVGEYRARGALPARRSGRVLAHELGHMLLNSGSHVQDRDNLMGSGVRLTDQQCRRMRQNREQLFGEKAVPDPGPPEKSG